MNVSVFKYRCLYEYLFLPTSTQICSYVRVLPILRQTFLRGLYYSTTLRGAPQVRVLCLNTNLYSTKIRLAAKVQGFAAEVLSSIITAEDERLESAEQAEDDADPGAQGHISSLFPTLVFHLQAKNRGRLRQAFVVRLARWVAAAGQLAWLEEELVAARLLGQQVRGIYTIIRLCKAHMFMSETMYNVQSTVLNIVAGI